MHIHIHITYYIYILHITYYILHIHIHIHMHMHIHNTYYILHITYTFAYTYTYTYTHTHIYIRITIPRIHVGFGLFNHNSLTPQCLNTADVSNQWFWLKWPPVPIDFNILYICLSPLPGVSNNRRGAVAQGVSSLAWGCSRWFRPISAALPKWSQWPERGCWWESWWG